MTDKIDQLNQALTGLLQQNLEATQSLRLEVGKLTDKVTDMERDFAEERGRKEGEAKGLSNLEERIKEAESAIKKLQEAERAHDTRLTKSEGNQEKVDKIVYGAVAMVLIAVFSALIYSVVTKT